jgi:uncharacterized protein (TIRG00374 family)
MKDKALNRLVPKMIVGITIGFAVVILLLFLGDVRKVLGVFHRLPLWSYVAAILFTLTSYAIRFGKWHVLVRVLGVKPTVKANLRVFLMGLSMSITPGKAGEWLKTYLLKVETGARPSVTTAAVIVDRLTDLFAMAVLIGLGSTVLGIGMWTVAIIVVALMLALLMLRQKRLMLAIIGLLTQPEKLRRMRRPLFTFTIHLHRLLGWKLFVILVIVSVVSWMGECLALFMLTTSLYLSLSLVQDIFIFSLGTVAGAVSMLPGGLGVAEGSMAGIFILFHIKNSVALSLTLLIRLVTLWMGVWIGFVTLLISRKRYFSKLGSKDKHENV